jgi:hypothetical protein
MRFDDANFDASLPQRSIVLCALVVACIVMTGCTRMTTTRVAQSHPTHLTSGVVKRSGEYAIEYRVPDVDHHLRVPGLNVVLITGDRVGFVRDPQGTLAALLPDQPPVPLPEIPAEATSVSFASRTREKTRFSKNVENATMVVGESALLGGGLLGFAAIDYALWQSEVSNEQQANDARAHGFDNAKDYKRWKRRQPPK